MATMSLLKKYYWLLSSQFGIDPIKFVRAVRSLSRYVQDYFKFRVNYKGNMEITPCLLDWYEESGTTRNEYFWQDLMVARMIFSSNPEKHVDIGSRVDGFVAHVASFREIEMLDIRPLSIAIPGVIYKQADMMNSSADIKNYCDSLSCLHALEHFGLGRYGDPINPTGYETGISNMANILRPGGIFYLSVPVGVERVEFNANRVFNPNTIVGVAKKCGLTLRTLSIFSSDKGLVTLDTAPEVLATLGKCRYGLGIFTFTKEHGN